MITLSVKEEFTIGKTRESDDCIGSKLLIYCLTPPAIPDIPTIDD